MTTYYRPPKEISKTHTSIKADQGYYLVSVIENDEPKKGEKDYYHYRVPIIGWRLTTTEWDNGDIETDYFPVALSRWEIEYRLDGDYERVGVEHPDGLIYTDGGIHGEQLQEFIESSLRVLKNRKERAKQAKATANHA